MREYKATVTHLTPAMGQILVGGAVAEFPSLHHAFFVGDILIKRDCRLLQNLAPNVRIVNMYGTTETSRYVVWFLVYLGILLMFDVGRSVITRYLRGPKTPRT